MEELKNNNLLNNNLENKEETKEKKVRKQRTPKEKTCYKCCIPIESTIGLYYICRDCYNTISKEYYHNKIKPNRVCVKRKKTCYQKDYTLTDGTIIQVNIKSDDKTCNKCLVSKNYTEFYTVMDKNNYYLQPRCKQCVNKNQNKIPKKLKEKIDNEINK